MGNAFAQTKEAPSLTENLLSDSIPPTVNEINFSLPAEYSQSELTVSVYNLIGKREIEFSQPAASLLKINIASLRPGVYFFRVITQGGYGVTRRFVRQ